MKSLKILLASIISAAFISPTFAEEEIGTVAVTANYVSSCTVPGLPTFNIDGNESYASEFILDIPFTCTIAHDNTRLELWVERFLIYPDEEGEETQHFMAFFRSFNVVPNSLVNASDDGAGGPGFNTIKFNLLDKGEHELNLRVKAKIGSVTGSTDTLKQPVRYESFTRTTPVHVAFTIEDE